MGYFQEFRVHLRGKHFESNTDLIYQLNNGLFYYINFRWIRALFLLILGFFNANYANAVNVVNIVNANYYHFHGIFRLK